MRHPFLTLVACVAAVSCSRAAAPAVAPAPAGTDVQTVPTPVPTPAPTAAPSPDRAAPREFRGAYTRGFEASWFAPCEAPMDDALWWVTLTEDARLQRDSLLRALTTPATGALAVRWKGTISARMPAGQMGRGTRYLLVTQILEVRPLPGEGACAPVSRTS